MMMVMMMVMHGGRCVPTVLIATAIVAAVVVGIELIAAVRRQVPDVVAAARVGGAYLFFFPAQLSSTYLDMSVSLSHPVPVLSVFFFPPPPFLKCPTGTLNLFLLLFCVVGGYRMYRM